MKRAMLGMVAGLWLVAVMVPGPNLLAVLLASARSRQAALLTVLGVGVGTACWGLAGSVGLQALFAAAPVVFVVFKLVGGGYLVLTGLRLLLRRRDPAEVAPQRGNAALAGLLTSLSNPKSALLVTSLFAATAPDGAPLRFGLEATAVMMGVALGWYGLVACVASGRHVSGRLDEARGTVEAIAGLAFTAFGVRLVLAVRT